MSTKLARSLSASATRSLLARIPNRLDPELSRELRHPVYVLEDGGAVLVAEDGTAAHWFSCEALVANNRTSVSRALQRTSPLSHALPNPERFPAEAFAMIAEIPTLLGVQAALLDYSEESLDEVDRAIKRLGAERAMTAEIFPLLIAYVGEVIRRHVRGEWDLRSTRDGTRLEPEIVDVTGGRYQLLGIYKELLEHGRTASMRAFVHVALRKHRMRPPH